MNSSRKKVKRTERTRSSSKDANNSFVSNVTSRVTGLLPASITNWFSSPSSSSANGSVPHADSDSSGNEAPVAPSPPSPHPPSKRMRLSPPAEYNHYDVTGANCVSTIETTKTQTKKWTIQSPPGRNTFRWETNFMSTPLRPTDEGESDDIDRIMPKLSSSKCSAGSSVSATRKSLFDIPDSDASKKACAKTACNSQRDPNQPCFKPSLLGSPFYPGRTMYGGSCNSYVYQPNIRQRKDQVVNSSNTSTADNSISHSARRIMDLLENYSSPLNDSRRIPQYTRPSITSHTIFDSSSQNTSNATSVNKRRELHVPSLASVLRLRQRSRLMDSTTAARQIIASHSSTVDYLPYPSPQTNRDPLEKETSNKFTTKVKSRLTRPKRGEQNDETDPPLPVNLPTAVLQIDQFKLPKFSLDPPSVAKPSPLPAARPPVITTVTRLNQKTSAISANSFKFSSPIRISAEDSPPPSKRAGFTFGSPERSIDHPKDNGKKNTKPFILSTPKPFENNDSTDKPKDWKCPDCWVSNKPDADVCVCCSGKKPTEKTSNSDGLKVNSLSGPTVKKAGDGWKCSDCWVSNDKASTQCVCCGCARPGTPDGPGASAAPATPKALNHIGGNWKCADCWIQNKSDVDRCEACGATKPGAEPQNTTAGSFKVIIKTQTDKWECPNCLVRVDDDKTNCVCCGTVKPGLPPVTKNSTFNFGTSTTTAFKFGIPNTQVTSATQPAENKGTLESKPKSEESETNNNVIAKVPSFTFGLPSKKSDDQTDSSKKSDNSTTKLNVKFGIPNSSAPATTLVAAPVSTAVKSTPAAISTAPALKFGVPNKLHPLPNTNEVTEENAQEVPQATFTATRQQETPSFTPVFESPVLKTTPEKPLSESAPSNTLLNAVKDSNSAASVLASTAASTLAAAAPTPTFSFGAAAAAVLFPAPKVTASSAFAAPTTTNAVPFFEKPELTTTTSSVSMFPSPNAISTTPMFQKNDAPAATTGSLFNFGSNNANATTTKPEAPKFNFTFGSNNQTDNPLLKPTPNTAADNTNKFSLPLMFGSGNNLTNSMGGVNGLPSGAPAGGNVPATTSNSLPTGGGMFGSPGAKDNMWSVTASAPQGRFATSAPSSTPQKPAAFSFGASTPFNAGTALAFGASTQSTPTFGVAAPAFGAATQSTPAFGGQTTPAFEVAVQSTPRFGAPSTPAFGANSSLPAFGASGQSPAFGGSQPPSTNLFGMGGQNGGQPSPFGSNAGGAAAPSMFGSAVGAPSGGLFGSSAVAVPTFGTTNPSQSQFEAPSLTPAPAPAFNFTPQASGVFGFGQPQQAPQGGAGVYAFGAGAGASSGGVQFNMGSGAAAQAAPTRRVFRKAVRRTNARQ